MLSEARIQEQCGEKRTLVKGAVQLPDLAPNQAVVKVAYVAQNAIDVQSLDSNAFGDGAVFGCDFTGTVQEVGEDAKNLKQGDLIAGLVWGGEIRGLGAYSDITYADDRLCFKVPKTISQEQAATIPLTCCTAWLALFSKDCLAIPRVEASTSILIWGGSTSVGLYAIQLAASFGFNVVAACSNSTSGAVGWAGATHVVDYHNDNVVNIIKATVPDITYVLDTIGNKSSSVRASEAVCAQGGTLCTVRPGKDYTENVAERVKVTSVFVWTAFLKDHDYGGLKWPASIEDHELASELFSRLPKLLESHAVNPNQVKLLNGLDALDEGFRLSRQGFISAYKVVYKI